MADHESNLPRHPSPDGARVLLAGGGSGGHVFPALALATELRNRGATVSFVGSAAGLEARLVPARGIAFDALAARPFLGRGPIDRARALAVLARSVLQARRLLRRDRIEVVVGTGGYVSAPAVVAARTLRRPVLLFEPNARPGSANRWLSRLANEAAIAFPEAARGLSCRSCLTGTPVGREFFAASEFEPRGTPRILVLGGSQGSAALNRQMPGAAAQLLERGVEFSLVHQSGANHLDETRRDYLRLGLNAGVEIVPFLSDVARQMEEAWLVVSRAGAITLAEICAAGRPSLLVPLAIAAGHQIENARAQEKAGAANVLLGPQADSTGLADAIAGLLADRQRLVAMARAARARARPDAASDLADQVERLRRQATAGRPGGAA